MDYPERFQDACQFEKVLHDLSSADNTIRATAEAGLEEFSREKRISLFILILASPDAPHSIVEISAVLLRRLVGLEFDDSVAHTSAEFQNCLKQELLKILESNLFPSLLPKICDVVSELAKNYIDEEGNNEWLELLTLLYNWSHSTIEALKVAALALFASVPDIFGNQQSKYLLFIHELLSDCLLNHPFKVQVAAVKALNSFLKANEKEVQVCAQFADCVEAMLLVIFPALDSQRDELDDMLRHAIEMIESNPKLFRKNVKFLMKLTMKGMLSENLETTTKNLCLEVSVTLSEAAPVMMKKLGAEEMVDLITCILKTMSLIEEDPKWDEVDEDDDEEDNENAAMVAEAALDRMACSLGGKTVMPITLHLIPGLLNSSLWQEKYAGLMAISAIGEGCERYMKAVLADIVDGILVYLTDSHSRVRYAACNAIGQMASDFAPVFQKKFHSKVIPALVTLLKDTSSSRVQAHAGAALVNVLEDCPKHILSPYMNCMAKTIDFVLSSRLNEFTKDGRKLVLEQALVTLASLADSAQEKFAVFYDIFIPRLKYIIQNAIQPELKILRGKAVECISLIGLAVGKEMFCADAKEIMEFILSSDVEFSDDDPQLSYMIAAWARMCKILGKDFQPYLEKVMPPILKAAAIKPELAVLDSDDMKILEKADGWEFVNLGEKHNFGIRTTGLDEKATACEMLMCFAKEVKEGFAPYVEPTAELMLPLLKFYFHDSVRTAAGEIIPCLLECAKCNGEDYLVKFWKLILPDFINALDAEPETDVLCEHFTSFGQCIAVMNVKALQEQELIQLIQILKRNLEVHFQKSELRDAARRDEDYDDVVEERLQQEKDEDNYLLCKISEILGRLFSVLKQDFLPFFEASFLNHYVHLLAKERSSTERHWSLFLFSDIIEYCGLACVRYKDYFLEPLVEALKHEEPDLRQTAGYTFGMLAQHGGPSFVSFCLENLPILAAMLNHPDARSEENEMAFENYVAAITKFLVVWSSEVNVNDILPMWLTWLPIWEDVAEVEAVYSFFCFLLESHHAGVYGADDCNLPKIVGIIADTFLKEALECSSSLGQRLISFLKQVKERDDLFRGCVSQLNFDQQKILNDICL